MSNRNGFTMTGSSTSQADIDTLPSLSGFKKRPSSFTRRNLPGIICNAFHSSAQGGPSTRQSVPSPLSARDFFFSTTDSPLFSVSSQTSHHTGAPLSHITVFLLASKYLRYILRRQIFLPTGGNSGA